MRNSVWVLVLLIILTLDGFHFQGANRNQLASQISTKSSNQDPSPLIVWNKENLHIPGSQEIVKLANLGGTIVQTYMQPSNLPQGVIDLTHVAFKLNSFNENTSVTTSSIADNRALLGVNDAWNQNITGQGAVVAIVDTGVDFSHPALVGKRFDGKSFVLKQYGYETDEGESDLFGHGTSVASIIAGNDTTNPYTGVAYNAKIVNAKVGDQNGDITSSALVAALDWVVGISQVSIINLSLGEPEDAPALDLLESIVNQASRQGKVVVASAGNNGNLGDYQQDPMTIGSPGSAVEAITVGGTTSTGTLYGKTSEGPTMNWEAKPDLIAPALNIEVAKIVGDYSSCNPSLCYRENSGTSFSAPFVSGISALLIQKLREFGKNPNPGMIKSILTRSAVDRGYPWYMQGNGLVNVTQALSYIDSSKPFINVFPKQMPYYMLTQIPQTISENISQTVISDSMNYWSVLSITGNASEIISIDPKQSELGYSQLISIHVAPSSTTPIGNYTAKITLSSPNGANLSSSITIQVLPKPTKRILLDLAHTPWSSILSPRQTRVERIFGQDVKSIVSIFRSKGMWVEEFMDGYLSYALLSKYDVIWMPSAFTTTVPLFYDHPVPRETTLTPDELFALYEYKIHGGRFLFDFGGTSILDSEFDYTIPDKDSLDSFLSLFDSQPGYITNQPSLNNVGMSNSSSYYKPGLYSQVGETTISNGLNLFGPTGNYISGFLGPMGSRALVINTRNWRDGDHIGTENAQKTAEFLVNWLLDTSFVNSLNINYQASDTIVTGELNLNDSSSFSVEGTPGATNIQIDNLSVQNNSFAFTIKGKTSGLVSLRFQDGSSWFDYQLELDNVFPVIHINDAIQYPDGTIDFSFEISDNSNLPTLNYLASLSNDIPHSEIFKQKSTYHIYANSSDITGSLVLNIQALDIHGNYVTTSKTIVSYSNPPKENLLVPTLALIGTIALIILAVKYRKKFQKPKKST